jgi:hypothetical protein
MYLTEFADLINKAVAQAGDRRLEVNAEGIGGRLHGIQTAETDPKVDLFIIKLGRGR